MSPTTMQGMDHSFNPVLVKSPTDWGKGHIPYKLFVNGECVDMWVVRDQQDLDVMLTDLDRMGVYLHIKWEDNRGPLA